VRTYVPHRVDEGYGLSSAAIAELCRSEAEGGGGAQLIISVDCGITALEPARVAHAAGVDLIITDHHNFATSADSEIPQLPDAFALLHPKLPSSQYPFAELCGAGVAFKLAWRLLTLAAGSSKLSDAHRELLLDLLGLCSLGVIADVVPLVDENRVIARFGLRRLRSSRIEGLRALIAASGFADASVDEEQVGFQLAPRLNACGRMGHAKEAVELLTTATGERADELAIQLSQQNELRRRIEREIFEEACELAEKEGMTSPDKRAIVLAKQGWHAGVVGIVCSRLVEKYHRPTLLLSEHDGMCHGSGRSVEGVSLHAALASCSSHLAKFGGHDMAAGLQCSIENFSEFAQAFIDAINRVLPADRLHAQRSFDCEACLKDLSLASLKSLDLLRPFGRDNPSITLALHNLRIASRPEFLGKTNKHLAMLVSDTSTPHAAVRCTGWNLGELVPTLRSGQVISLLAKPKISTFGGSARVELDVVDVMPTAMLNA
jgi:single-stranded-DNA-specific exonuclease